MSLLRRILGRLNRFDVGDGRGDTFFTRYDLLKTRWGSVYLHEFHRSDRDRCEHDHPWSFTTIIVRGGYWEQIEGERHWRRPGYVGVYPATHRHRIEIDADRPRPWSIVFVGLKTRAWGFWTTSGWVAWVKGQGNPICGDERP